MTPTRLPLEPQAGNHGDGGPNSRMSSWRWDFCRFTCLGIQRDLHLVECLTIIIAKFLIINEQETPHSHFVLGHDPTADHTQMLAFSSSLPSLAYAVYFTWNASPSPALLSRIHLVDLGEGHSGQGRRAWKMPESRVPVSSPSLLTLDNQALVFLSAKWDHPCLYLLGCCKN